MTESHKNAEKTKWYKKPWGIILIVLLVVYFGSALLVRFFGDPKAENKKSPETATVATPEPTQELKSSTKSARGYVDDKQIITPTHVQFVGSVLNTGESASRFTCYAEASDANDEQIGNALVKTTEIKPGEYFKYTVEFETSKPASLIKYSRLTCE